MEYIENFITEDEEAKMIAHINYQPWSSRNGRHSQVYGYKYEVGSTDQYMTSTIGIPRELITVFDRVTKYCDRPLNQLTIHRYERLQGIDAHIDHVTRFGDIIAGISLGSNTTIIFKHPVTKHKVEYVIQPRSLYIMRDDIRYKYTHKINKVCYDIIDGDNVPRQTRHSLTMRQANIKCDSDD